MLRREFLAFCASTLAVGVAGAAKPSKPPKPKLLAFVFTYKNAKGVVHTTTVHAINAAEAAVKFQAKHPKDTVIGVAPKPVIAKP